MSLKIGGYLFYGPFAADQVKIRKNQAPVAFAVICRAGAPWNPTFRLIHVDFSGTEGMVAAEHPSLATWQAANEGTLQFYLFDLESAKGDPALRAAEIVSSVRAAYLAPNNFISLAKQ